MIGRSAEVQMAQAVAHKADPTAEHPAHEYRNIDEDPRNEQQKTVADAIQDWHDNLAKHWEGMLSSNIYYSSNVNAGNAAPHLFADAQDAMAMALFEDRHMSEAMRLSEGDPGKLKCILDVMRTKTKTESWKICKEEAARWIEMMKKYAPHP